jgi:hypothetical protein
MNVELKFSVSSLCLMRMLAQMKLTSKSSLRNSAIYIVLAQSSII